MPVVATSEPLIFGETGPSPSPTIPYIPPTTPVPIQPIIPSSNFVAAHQQFIKQIDNLNNCFKDNQITNFTNTEIQEHIQIAMIDKYLVQHDDMYCSKQGIKNLSDKLKRFID